MTYPTLPDDLVIPGDGRIVLVVLDGLGGLPHPDQGKTELEAARTPVLDALAARSSLGRLTPVVPGVTPGSGPAHLSLFGYDPVRNVVGRGALSALGVGFGLEPGDLAVRLNLATLNREGEVVDRRAGRPSDAVGQEAVARLQDGLDGFELQGAPVDVFVRHEKEHRAVLVLRAPGLDEGLQDTDPQETGVPPRRPAPLVPSAEPTAQLLERILSQARELLKDQTPINGILARGYAVHRGFPSMEDRFGLRGVAVAQYPMYRGVSRLVGMEAAPVPGSDEEAVAVLEEVFGDFDFHFLHFKSPDARGEDGDFQAKVEALESLDGLLDRVVALNPEVLAITGDHSTPAAMAVHSWHPVPLLIQSRWVRPSAAEFGESTCRTGELGQIESRHLMSLCLAHAGRLRKFGA